MTANQSPPARPDGDALRNYRLLADRLRWVFAQRSIDLPLAGEVLKKLPEIISGLDALVATSPARDTAEDEADQDPPTKWLIDRLRGLALDLVLNPATTWIGPRDAKQHICWIAADRLKAAPPKPAPDAVREAAQLALDTFNTSDNVEHLMSVMNKLAAALSAPVPPADGATIIRCMEILEDVPGLNLIDRVNRIVDWHRQLTEEYHDLKASPSATGAAEPGTPYIELPLTFWYKNHRGEEALRTAFPISIRFGTTEYHPEAQWLLKAFDRDKQAEREFAMRDMLATPPVRGDREVDKDQLIACMALALQTVQGALQHTNNSPDALAAALSSVTIALGMEAEHWQKYASRQPPQSSSDEGTGG